VQFGGAHGVSGQQVKGRLAVLVAHVGHGAVLQQQLGVLGLLQHARKVQRRVAHGALYIAARKHGKYVNIVFELGMKEQVVLTIKGKY